MPASAGQFHCDIREGSAASVGEDTDMRAVRGMRDPCAESLDIIEIQNDNFILTYQFQMMRCVL